MLIINNNFKNLIPPLSDAEYQQLEQNILANGCLDSIKIWQGTIVDGHNRYEICVKHAIHYDTDELDFADMADAKIWIINNQFGRRNLNSYQRGELAIQ